ncbi:AEC family transporter [Agrobacterium vitis]|uniref:AEC family transporter n=1 Tax=Agrobacterium vitis TaxID=373 RepID=UPI001F2D76F6|nr:AEC family transporter [Agrobacterium vitis]
MRRRKVPAGAEQEYAMWSILAVTIPVFTIIVIGYVAGRINLIGQKAGTGLMEYVFAISLPALIIETLSTSTMPDDNPWGYWFAYFGGVLIVWVVGMFVAGRFFGVGRREAAIHGFTAAQSNTILVGMPIILQAYGREAATPFFLLIAVHLPVMMAVATTMIEGKQDDADWWDAAVKLLKTLVSHPILIALAIGLGLRFVGLVPSGFVIGVLKSLGDTAIPCSLIALGLSLARFGIAGDLRPAIFLSVLKLMLHPFSVWLLAFHVFRVPPVWAGVAVLFAAMPTGINSHILATRYQLAERATSTATLLTTIAAGFTISFWLFVLGV